MLTKVFLLELLKKVESKTVTFVIDAEYAVWRGHRDVLFYLQDLNLECIVEYPASRARSAFGHAQVFLFGEIVMKNASKDLSGGALLNLDEK